MANRRISSGSGPSQRQLRVGEVIRRRLSDVLARGDVHDPDLGRLSITVSEVRCSSDLKQATVFVMPLGGHEVEAALAGLKRNKAELRHHVARELTLKYAPELRFQLDSTFDRIDETRRLFSDARVRADVEATEPEAPETGIPGAGTGEDDALR
jgi:ribosome-binding factor A